MTKTEETPLYKSLSGYIKTNLFGCNFVGVTDDGEVFLTFDHKREGLVYACAQDLIQAFSPRIKKISIVEKLDIQKAEELVEELNSYIEGLEPKAKPTLLQIEGLDETASS